MRTRSGSAKTSSAKTTSTKTTAAKTTRMLSQPSDSPDSGRVMRLRVSVSAAELGPGAHFAKLSKKLEDGRFEAHLLTGEMFEASLSPEVDVALADQCMRDQANVLVGRMGGGRGDEIVMFGALQTKVEEAHKPDEVRIEASRRIVLSAGKSRIELGADGKMKLVGNDVTLDAPREIRLASAHVEIP